MPMVRTYVPLGKERVVTTLARDLHHPWAVAMTQGGDLIVTQRGQYTRIPTDQCGGKAADTAEE